MSIFENWGNLVYGFLSLYFVFLVSAFMIYGLRFFRKALKYLEYMNQKYKYDVDDREYTSLGKKK